MRLQSSRWLRAPAVFYIDAIRATPLLAQLYFLYFGLPLLEVTMPKIVVALQPLVANAMSAHRRLKQAGRCEHLIQTSGWLKV